jgi:hypothetical protein
MADQQNPYESPETTCPTNHQSAHRHLTTIRDLMKRCLTVSGIVGGTITVLFSCVLNGIENVSIHVFNALIGAGMFMVPGALIAIAIYQRRNSSH